MILVVLICISRTFTFLRIYSTLTPIVVMLKTVIQDLKPFMFMFFLLIFFFANSLAVMSMGIDATVFMTEEELALYELEQAEEGFDEEGIDEGLEGDLNSTRRMLSGGEDDSDPFFAIGGYMGV
jgi:hypothetical protein